MFCNMRLSYTLPGNPTYIGTYNDLGLKFPQNAGKYFRKYVLKSEGGVFKHPQAGRRFRDVMIFHFLTKNVLKIVLCPQN